MRVAIIGATGLVGQVMARVLEEQQFPVDELLPVASARSVGSVLPFRGKEYTVIGLEAAVKAHPDLALFSAGSSVSRDWAPRFAAANTIVVDNSSAWRMDPDVPLVVPEVNADVLQPEDRIIANPNCSTIQLVVALAPLHETYGIERLVISTYQSVTGTGVKAVKQYQLEAKGFEPKADERAYPYTIFENCLPHCDTFLDNGYTREEMKLVHESRKILRSPELAVTATAIRVPVHGGHSESVNVTLQKPFELEAIRQLLTDSPGIIVKDNPAENIYPMPRFAKGKNEVFVGRIRRDESVANGLNMWIVADNLRKGAATNAVQIAQHLLQQGYLNAH